MSILAFQYFNGLIIDSIDLMKGSVFDYMLSSVDIVIGNHNTCFQRFVFNLKVF